MEKNRPNKKQPYLYAIGLIIVLLVIFGIFYKNNQYATLQIESFDKNLTIFIDNQRKTAPQDINPQFKLKNGKHTIVISKEKYWPWIKEIEIKKESNSTVRPFFIPQNTSGLLIGEADPEYLQILSLFEENLISNQALAILSDDNAVLKTSITAIDFYKNREDVVLISSGDGVFALEIDSENIQNFQPIYKGKSPVFVKKDNSSIYILDNDNLMIVNY